MSKFVRSMLSMVMLTLLTVQMLGCAGTIAIPSSARAGDTIVLGAGWKKRFNREGLTVTITGADSSVATYLPGDPAVRAVIDLYPDPLSYIVVGTRIGSNDRYGSTYGSLVNTNFTGNDPDWWQTSIYLDLPASLPVGAASVKFQSAGGESYGPIPVNIIPGQGSPSPFTAELLGDMSPTQMQSMERMPSYTVRFSGGFKLAASIQVELLHSPDSTAGGVGRAFVVNPRGEMKNLAWTDNGTTMRVILLHSGDGTTKDPYITTYGLRYFKFYITGGISGLVVNSVKAYDINGNPIAGVTASIQ